MTIESVPVSRGMSDSNTLDHLSELSESSGVRKITILSWRDAADPEAGGSEVHTSNVANLWAQAGIDVTIRTSKAPGLAPLEQRDGYQVVRRSGRHGVFPASIVEQLVSTDRSDGILEVWNGVPFLTPLWCGRPKATFIHHVHRDMWDLALGPALASLGRLIERRIAPPFYRRERILTPSAASKEEIVDYLRLSPHRVRVVEPGVDSMFSPGGDRTPYPSILVVGRLVPHKQVERLVEMLPRIRQRVPDTRLVVVGEGYHKSEIELAIERNSIGHAVELRGRVSNADLVQSYREAWVLASASLAEGWGMTITEAAACGTPAVVSRIGGHTNAVQEGVSGQLADSPEELAEKLIELLQNARLRLNLSQGARARGTTLSWGATATAILEEMIRH